MRERTGQILKIACLALAALLLFQLVKTAFRINPLARVVIPALPTLASDTNAPAGASVSGQARVGTNVAGTNVAVAKTAKGTGTNLAVAVSGTGVSPVRTGTNGQELTGETPVPLPVKPATNSAAALTPALSPSEGEREKTAVETIPISIAFPADMTNALPVVPATNSPAMRAAVGTNVPLGVATVGTNAAGTNASAKSKTTNSPSAKAAMTAMNMSSSMMRSGGGGKSDLPPEVKARVDRIYESELFGQVMRPQPMALQGIAGNAAFLRSPSGQTGLVKEGDSLGEIKLVRIGINRVLVEQDGKKTELTIFDGYGGESLMPKDKETSK